MQQKVTIFIKENTCIIQRRVVYVYTGLNGVVNCAVLRVRLIYSAFLFKIMNALKECFKIFAILFIIIISPFFSVEHPAYNNRKEKNKINNIFIHGTQWSFEISPFPRRVIKFQTSTEHETLLFSSFLYPQASLQLFEMYQQ